MILTAKSLECPCLIRVELAKKEKQLETQCRAEGQTDLTFYETIRQPRG